MLHPVFFKTDRMQEDSRLLLHTSIVFAYG